MLSFPQVIGMLVVLETVRSIHVNFFLNDQSVSRVYLPLCFVKDLCLDVVNLKLVHSNVYVPTGHCRKRGRRRSERGGLVRTVLKTILQSEVCFKAIAG